MYDLLELDAEGDDEDAEFDGTTEDGYGCYQFTTVCNWNITVRNRANSSGTGTSLPSTRTTPTQPSLVLTDKKEVKISPS